MLRDVLPVAALLGAFAYFQWVSRRAKALGVDRSVEKKWPYRLGDDFSDRSGKYVSPILFPLDLIAMAALAVSFAWGSMAWGPRALGWPPNAFLVLPLAYFAFDLAEDCLLALLLKQKVAINGASKALLLALTGGKMVTFLGAAAVTLVAGAKLLVG